VCVSYLDAGAGSFVSRSRAPARPAPAAAFGVASPFRRRAGPRWTRAGRRRQDAAGSRPGPPARAAKMQICPPARRLNRLARFESAVLRAAAVHDDGLCQSVSQPALASCSSSCSTATWLVASRCWWRILEIARLPGGARARRADVTRAARPAGRASSRPRRANRVGELGARRGPLLSSNARRRPPTARRRRPPGPRAEPADY
jgi:hypothetical protein